MATWIGIAAFWVTLLWAMTGFRPLPVVLLWVLDKFPQPTSWATLPKDDWIWVTMVVLMLGAGVWAIVAANV
jgi:hypothetical protein